MWMHLLLFATPVLSPSKLAVEDVRLSVDGGAVELAGTLTLPEGDAPAPGIVMVTGSGDQVRDQVISGAPMFRWIAEHLTRAGFAVLRVDERGVGASGGDGWPQQDSSSRLADVRACYRFLAEHERVDGERVGLLGHSEGAMLAPRLAALEEGVAFVVLLAPPALPGHRIFLAQRSARVEGEERRTLRIALANMLDVSATDATREELDAAGRLILRAWGMDDDAIRERGESELEAIRGLHTSPWYREFVASDPALYLSTLAVPTLALFGSADRQTPPDLHLVPLTRCLLEAPVEDFAIHVLPDQDHFFLRQPGAAPGEHAFGRMRLSDDLLVVLGQWLVPRFVERSTGRNSDRD